MDEGTIGEVRLFAGNFAPRNWAFCEGNLLPINNYEALYSVLGTAYGGDGRTTFGLPKLANLPGESGGELRYIICINGMYPTRQ